MALEFWTEHIEGLVEKQRREELHLPSMSND